jgi:hypothetical protein
MHAPIIQAARCAKLIGIATSGEDYATRAALHKWQHIETPLDEIVHQAALYTVKLAWIASPQISLQAHLT